MGQCKCGAMRRLVSGVGGVGAALGGLSDVQNVLGLFTFVDTKIRDSSRQVTRNAIN